MCCLTSRLVRLLQAATRHVPSSELGRCIYGGTVGTRVCAPLQLDMCRGWLVCRGNCSNHSSEALHTPRVAACRICQGRSARSLGSSYVRRDFSGECLTYVV